MIVATLTPGGSTCATEEASVAHRLAVMLTGRAPNLTIGADDENASTSLQAAGLVVICATARQGTVDPQLLELLRSGWDIGEAMVFIVTIGPWPQENQTADRRMRPLLLDAGAFCPAPSLHISNGLLAGMESYSRYWAPFVGSLASTASWCSES